MIRLTFSLLLLFSGGLPTVASGCTHNSTPIDRFDRSEYVLLGEVVGFVGPLHSARTEGPAWALQLRSRAIILAAKRPARYFQLLPTRLMSDCSMIGWEQNELATRYPIGSLVHVVALAANDLTPTCPAEDIRLEAGVKGNTRIAPATAASSVANGEVGDYRRMLAERGTEQTGARICPPAFWELRKDLLRLELARTMVERRSILHRLAYYPSLWDGLDFPSIVKRYVGNRSVRRNLLQLRSRVESTITPIDCE